MSQKKIESSKVGGRVVFRPEQLEAAIEPNDRPGSRRGRSGGRPRKQ
ncbi:MAG TPA: hypothetical protein ENN69_00850 [Spirochaetia bacterium]|nr:hypothetical protein [Spirochaetia bacterium]